ncbi:hypothetical protein BRADI_5g02600v3 [Brachypodium distachyon]|uniref:Uncharacterized protein n=1 Tax=Brachypodium distachyon TaxID=15368 RepID=A0A0Q3NZ92_BRADI|nr:hypothetical protein BRADI_5g02600v3 [Brachypodium distachyon]
MNLSKKVLTFPTLSKTCRHWILYIPKENFISCHYVLYRSWSIVVGPVLETVLGQPAVEPLWKSRNG